MQKEEIRRLRGFARLIRLFGVILLFLLLGFQSIPVAAGIDADAINAAGIQRTRAEVFAKDALILQYRPVDTHVQAINDLQVTLPLFEQEQQALAIDVRPDVQIVAATERPDFLAIDTAVRAILARPDGPVDPVEVSIILQHDRQYVATENSIVLILTQAAEHKAWSLFWIETFILGCVLVMAVIFGIREERTLSNILKQSEEKGEAHGTTRRTKSDLDARS